MPKAPLFCIMMWLIGRLAQLVRAPRLHRGGHKFESCTAHLNKKPLIFERLLYLMFGFFPVNSAGAKLAVAGITQTGHNVTNLVEVVIYRANVDVYIRVSIVQGLDPLRRGDNPHKFDSGGAPFF